MINRSNKHISDALMITDDLMGSVGNQSGVTDEAGYIIVFGLIRDCICKIRHQPEIQERKVKKVRKHTNAMLVVFAAAALLIFSAPSANANIILSADMSETLGGLSFASRDLAEYDPSTDTSTLYFDGALFGSWPNIDAVHVLDNGNIILSTANDATLGGLSFIAGDLIEYDATTDTATLFFDGSLFSASENIDAAHILDNGNIILSTLDGATLGGMTFGSGDLVEYNPLTDTSTLFFDGSLFDSPENIDAAHLLDNGNIIISTAASATLGGLSFADGDLIEYNLTTDVATLYFDEGLFSNNADINAVHELPEPATIALLGLGMMVLILRRHRITHLERALCYSMTAYKQG